ncbi:epsin-1-like [Diaphorina citri]|uniref:Epsin-1-like n=1 Tax=Diaphorina citri TaxID=121845 RepID=A0A3Q0J4P8_DIACI|nr:epsin-1-like [Diaphorina citri]
MRRQREDIQEGVAGLRRNIKNLAHNYSDAQVKVREATSNDPWGPSSSLMSEIADLTYNVVAFTEIMAMIWKRLNDSGKNWRHVYKALSLLEYLIKTGSDKVTRIGGIFTHLIKTRQHLPNVSGTSLGGAPGADPFDVSTITEDLRSTLLTNPSSTPLQPVKKTPQSFLGENSALVNLDNLITAPPAVPALPVMQAQKTGESPPEIRSASGAASSSSHMLDLLEVDNLGAVGGTVDPWASLPTTHAPVAPTPALSTSSLARPQVDSNVRYVRHL